MVEMLAKAKYPGGTDLVEERDQEKAFARTAELLAADPAAVIYEAAALHERFLARVDILRREGDALHLIEVKSSSVGDEDVESDDGFDEFVSKKGASKGDPKAKWMPYLLDITFQRMALALAFPEFKRIKASLCLINKSAVARDCETLENFRLTPQESDDPERPRARPLVEYLGDPQQLAHSELMVTRDVTELTDRLMERVRTRARDLANLLQPGGQAAAVNPSLPDVYKFCKKCEYRLKGEKAQAAEAAGLHGFQDCWGDRASTEFHILDLSRVTEIAPRGEPGPVEALIQRGGSSFLELAAHELGEEGKSLRERRYVQWANSLNGGQEHLPQELVDELRSHRIKPGRPIHFLDFEACNVALPHHAGLRPYERIVFQFSCHTLTGSEDEQDPLPPGSHRSWLNTERAFPNFKFARELQQCLGEDGTVYVWSPFESVTLAVVLRQLGESLQRDARETVRLAGAASVAEVHSLVNWLERLLGPEQFVKRKVKRVSPRIRDLHKLCLQHYFHPQMFGRTSIKVVLPAVWRNQPRIHQHPHFAEYLKRGADGLPLDPYKTLPALPVEEDDDEDVVNDGTGAIRIYQDLIFRRGAKEEFTANRRKLLERYCKLDTAAMIMIWKHWSREIVQP
jgi:hypothetical protein